MKIGPNGERIFFRSKKTYLFTLCGAIVVLLLFFIGIMFAVPFDSIIYKKANFKKGLSSKVSDLYGVHTDYRYNTLFFKTKDNKLGCVGGLGFSLSQEKKNFKESLTRTQY